MGRQLGLLIDRQGRVDMLIVGDPTAIYIPELSRARLGEMRLRGLRLLHTHLSAEGLSQEDLMDMVSLRLDSVAALTVSDYGEPLMLHVAHVVPVSELAGPDAKPYDVLPPVRWDRSDVDFAALVAALEDEFARAERSQAEDKGRERAVLVSVSREPRIVQERSLEELAELARTAGLAASARMVQRVATADSRHILGKGKLQELEVLCLQTGAQIVIFDQDLSPSQLRNLAETTERRVLDRTQLILDIFAGRATSRAGKLQVEMAQLKYTLPRLVGKTPAMSRLMGGIGGRGPGETKLEIDRRRVRERITKVKKELEDVRRHRSSTRDRRAKAGAPVIALVGYTNAGKSTLLNTLTGSSVMAENKLFATLDPTSRRIRFPREREVILTDTVGFIRRLPPDLKEAFRATLEELESADVLVHVADASHPEAVEQITAVESILAEMDLGDTPRLLALNKWEVLTAEQQEIMQRLYPAGIPVTALERRGLIPLVAAILGRLPVDALVGPVQGAGAAAPQEDSSPDDWLADWEPGSGVVQ
ncbi:MAG: GTPase HflX [Humidesulfovibrio sp.]|uniref:GTPase HflX n=1 Tax=Humidesulfovibrio sp. TaxID=2910988 RepID=UPI0027E7D148|nr:GTPase HflX [Humidesulfovibrio sp.]MDQ7835690.1 GTPase HflX [Humidesulfovibrio sp.]